MKQFKIQHTDKSLEQSIQQKIDHLNKPKGSLGRLEELALQICLIQQTLTPSLNHPCHLLLGGDHGIEREGVSVSPREVTWQQMINFTHGGGGVNMFCRQHGFKLRIVDTGVDYDLTNVEGIIDRKIARGTRNFLHEPAMSQEEFDRFTAQDATFIFVTNEIGSGGVSVDAVQRRFTDLQGWMNQYIASHADEVILMVSGIPVTVKSEKF